MRPDKRIRQKLRGTGTYLITETLKSNISFTRKIRTTFHVLLYLYYMIRNNLDVNVPEGWRKYLPLVQVSFQGKEVQTLYLYDYIPYDPPGQVETLKRELGWEAPLGKEAKLDCKLHPIASYQSLMANGISSDGFTFCVLIRYGLMSRTQAQEKEALLRKSLAQDCERSLAELGFSASELLH